MDSSPPEIPLEQAVDRLVDAANGMREVDLPPPFRDALNALARYSDPQAVRNRIAERIGEIRSPRGIGFLAVWLGGGVEHGLDPEPAIPHLMAAMLRLCANIKLPAPDNGEEDPGLPSADRETVDGLEWLGQGLVAHLARSPAARATYAGQPDLLAELERVEQVAIGCLWVHELLAKRSGTLLVLHVEGRTGVRVRYENLSNNFHLFTLLQAALAGRIPGTQRVAADVLAMARGESREEVSDSAWWHYGVPMVPEPNVAASIWGEMSPEQIPAIDGEQVMLLWPPQLGRSWDGNFFLPYIESAPPKVEVVEELTVEQFEAWRSKLNLPLGTPRPWWKLW